MRNSPRPIYFLIFVLVALASFESQKIIAQTTTAQLASQTNAAAHGRELALRSPPRRITPLRLTETPGGSRVIIASDAAFDDYTAARDGDHFNVRIPNAVASFAADKIAGRGFSSVQVEQQGEEVRVSFQLQAGATVHLSKGFNRLEIVFTVQQISATEDSAPAATSSVNSANSSGAAMTSGGSDDREALKQMRAQMEQLEARIKELEDKQAKTDAPQTAPNAVQAANAPQAAAGAQPVTSAANQPERKAIQSSANDAQHDEMNMGTPHLQIQGFADVDYRASTQKGTTNSFALGQLDLFITSRLSEKFSVLSELILAANQQNQFTFEVHRLLLKYQPNDYFSLSAGRYHTAIGYYNTAYHHGSWFQTAVDRPFIFAFEDSGGILPLHNVGLSLTGRIPNAPFGLHYIVEVGNGRASRSPLDRPVQTAVDENNGKAVNFGMFARPSSLPGFQTGFSVYRDQLTPAGLPKIGQTILAGYVVYQNPRYEFLNEVIVLRHNLNGRIFQTPAFYSQIARRFGNFKPYFRYQYVNVPSDDPIFPDVGRRNGPSLGVRYDLTDFAAFKTQFDRTQRRGFETFNDFILQLAFTF